MNSPFLLKPGQSIIIDGTEMSYEEIMDSKIDSIIYRNWLKKRMGESY